MGEQVGAMTSNPSRRSFLIHGAAAATAVALTRSAIGGPARQEPIRNPNLPAGASGTIWIGGDLQVNRIGLGAAEFTGPDRTGDPSDPAPMYAVLRRAVELGVNFIDTSDQYGRGAGGASERVIHDVLYPYPSDLVIATKGGQLLGGRPEKLREACETSLKRLGLEQIKLYQLHWPDKAVPYEDSVGELAKLQKEGKIRHIGICNVDAAHVAKARSVATVASIQNEYNILETQTDGLIEVCERDKIAFIPYGPLGGARGRALREQQSRLDGIKALAKARQISLPQALLAWLLARSPMMLPIPGTTKVDHLEDNVGSAKVRFTKQEMAQAG